MREILTTAAILTCVLGNTACRQTAPVNSNQINSNVQNSSNHNSAAATANNDQIPVYTYEIVNAFKHDDRAFTQGLQFMDGWLYESTGQEGSSTIRRVELATGDVKKKETIKDEDVFGEGMTILDNKIYQITWQSNVCYVYDKETFKPIKTLNYSGEGWGLTNDGKNLIMSDGSHQITFRNPENFEVLRKISVFRENGKPLMNLNELEYVKGEIWANIWHSESTGILGKENYIARINPENGKIIGWIDLAGISPEDSRRDLENTLNGIAYDAENDRIFVTGKQWRKLFEIKVKPKS